MVQKVDYDELMSLFDELEWDGLDTLAKLLGVSRVTEVFNVYWLRERIYGHLMHLDMVGSVNEVPKQASVMRPDGAAECAPIAGHPPL